MIEKEVWKPFKWSGEETNILVSSYGRIKNTKGDFITPFKSADNYLMVGFKTADGKRVIQGVHRLVAILFVENEEPESQIEVHHKDGLKYNNRADNLQWLSKKKHAEVTYFENHPEITAEMIHRICKDIAESGHTLKRIAKDYGVRYEFVYNIYRRSTFNDISTMYDFSTANTKGLHKDRSAYIEELDSRISAGEKRSSIIDWLTEEYEIDISDAQYIHDRRKAVLLHQGPFGLKIAKDQKEKYSSLFLYIEEKLLSGADTNELTREIMQEYPELGYQKSRDLVKQRARAILDNKKSLRVSLIGREKDIERLRRQVNSRSVKNHVDKYAHLYTTVESRLLDGDKFMDIAHDLMRDYDLTINQAKNLVNKRVKALKENTSVIKPVGFTSRIASLRKKK